MNAYIEAYGRLLARDTQDRGFVSRDLNIILITLSLAFYGARCYSRFFLNKNAGLDDAIIGVALVLAITLSALEIQLVQYGAGRQEAEVAADDPHGLDSFFRTLPTMQLLYLAGTGIVRLGITAFLPRLTHGLAREKTFRNIIILLASAIAALTIGAVFGLLFECWPVKDLWNKSKPGAKCYSAAREADLMYIHAAMGIVFDIILFVLPLWIIKSSAIVLKPRLIIIFSIALVAVIAGLARLIVILKVDMAVNTTYNIVSASIWTDLEIHVGIWVSCFPAMQPLLRMCTKRLGIKSTVSNTAAGSRPYDRYGRTTQVGTQTGKYSDTAWIMLEEGGGMQRNRIEGATDTSSDTGKGIHVRTRIEISRDD